jgi:hypothetical protein
MLLPESKILARDISLFVRRKPFHQDQDQHNFLVQNCPQSFLAQFKHRLSSLMTQMMHALRLDFAGRKIKQFQMGFCTEGCNVMKQRCWCMWWCMMVYGGVWWCMVVYGNGGVCFVVVVYVC